MQSNLPIALADLLLNEGSEVNIGGSEPGVVVGGGIRRIDFFSNPVKA
jgi:hypothetical protein